MFFYSRQRAPDDQRLVIYSVLLILTRGHDLSRSANAVSAGNRKFLNLWKSFTDPETRVFHTADGEDLVILARTVFD